MKTMLKVNAYSVSPLFLENLDELYDDWEAAFYQGRDLTKEVFSTINEDGLDLVFVQGWTKKNKPYYELLEVYKDTKYKNLLKHEGGGEIVLEGDNFTLYVGGRKIKANCVLLEDGGESLFKRFAFSTT